MLSEGDKDDNSNNGGVRETQEGVEQELIEILNKGPAELLNFMEESFEKIVF